MYAEVLGHLPDIGPVGMGIVVIAKARKRALLQLVKIVGSGVLGVARCVTDEMSGGGKGVNARYADPKDLRGLPSGHQHHDRHNSARDEGVPTAFGSVGA